MGVWLFLEFSVVRHFVSDSEGKKLEVIVMDYGKVQWLPLESNKLLIFNYS